MWPKEVQWLIQRAWDWDLLRFASELGMDPRDPCVRQQFIAFQAAARALSRVSAEVLDKVLAPYTPDPKV